MQVYRGVKGRAKSALEKEMDSLAEPIRIVIVDAHWLAREGFRMLIKGQDDMVIVAEAETAEQALTAVREQKPNIVVLDLDLGGVNIVERIPEILEASNGSRVLVLTGIYDTGLHLRAVRLGAMGLILKNREGTAILKSIRRVHAGEAWIERSMTANLVVDISSEEEKRSNEAAKIERLSQRERDIVRVLCQGLTNKQIADTLFISEFTVRNHLTSILSKLELSDRLELAIYSYRHGLGKIPY